MVKKMKFFQYFGKSDWSFVCIPSRGEDVVNHILVARILREFCANFARDAILYGASIKTKFRFWQRPFFGVHNEFWSLRLKFLFLIATRIHRIKEMLEMNSWAIAYSEMFWWKLYNLNHVIHSTVVLLLFFHRFYLWQMKMHRTHGVSLSFFLFLRN